LLACAIINQAGFKARFFARFNFLQGFGISHGKFLPWIEFIAKVLYFTSQDKSTEIVRRIGRTKYRQHYKENYYPHRTYINHVFFLESQSRPKSDPIVFRHLQVRTKSLVFSMDTGIDFFLRGRGFFFELSIEYVGQNRLSVNIVGHLTKRNGIADVGISFFLK
jgi:hypothetical protein